MEEFREQLLFLITTPLYIIIIGAEILLSNYHHRKLYSWKDTAANIYLMLANTAIELLIRTSYFGLFIYLNQHAIYQFADPVVYWIALIIIQDFLFYWLHRFDHEIRLFWAVHVTHHSSEQMNFTVGFRSSLFQPFYRHIYFLPLAWLGFRPMDIVFIFSVTQIWGICVHTELIRKMGWLEYILVTPSHHRVHHASNAKYLDKNMGMLLIFWDKLFGTFQPELLEKDYQPIKYGLTKPLEKDTPVTIIFHEWDNIRKDISRKDIGWKEKYWYIFGPPGWSHDGSRLTSEQLREVEDGFQASTGISHSGKELVEIPTLVNIDGDHRQGKQGPDEY